MAVRRKSNRPAARRRVGIALAGGGPLGAVYEIGALAALADCLEGIDFTRLDVYVGVSSGAFVTAALANGISPAEMCRMFIESDVSDEPFDPAILLRPAWRELAGRIAMLPGLAAGAAWRHITAPRRTRIVDTVRRLGRAVPAGLFDGSPIDASLAKLFARPGRTNDFRKLKRRLFIVATDLDSGKAVEFGGRGFTGVPISRAVQASAALPGLFPPVEIGGRHYADGALKKTLHASVALRHGARLVFCLNPLVPFDAGAARRAGHAGHPRRVVEGGLPTILAQTFRTLLRSRLQAGLERYRTEFADADLVLFEPRHVDAEMFFASIFSYSSRRRLAEHAYQRTREELLKRAATLTPILARHGIRIDREAAADPTRSLVAAPARRRRLLRFA